MGARENGNRTRLRASPIVAETTRPQGCKLQDTSEGSSRRARTGIRRPAPRLVGPFVLLVLVSLVAPALDKTTGQRAGKLGLVGVGIFIAALAIFIPIFNQPPAARQLPEARPDAFFEDSAYAPKKGEWSADGGGQSAQRYSELAQITPANVKDLKRAWTFHTGDMPKKYGSELTPLKVGDAIYGCTPMTKLLALNAASGEKLWIYDPPGPGCMGAINRGVSRCGVL